MLDALDGAAVRRWCTTALARLTTAADELNRLNVYPVKDADTGVNLVATMQALCAELPESADLPTMLRAMSRAALVGAHGNSGNILSQLLRGVSEAADGEVAIGPDALADGLRQGAELAYRAVSAPNEGTILTVARLAADAAGEAATDGGQLADVVRAAAETARVALAHTPEQLPALAEAGVVDAGGRGWCVMLDALVEVVAEGGVLPTASPRDEPAPIVARDPGQLAVQREAGSPGYAYEVQYLLDADDRALDTLRARLDELGDSLVVVGGDGLWNVHVHVNDVAAAIEAGIEAGRPHRLAVTRFADQIAANGGPHHREPAEPAGPSRVIAMVDGPGVAELVRAAGGCPVELGGPAVVDELLAAVRAVPGDQIALLPNRADAADTVDAVVAAARAEGRTVAVVPSRSMVAGVAALAVHDPHRPFGEDVISMASAAAATRSIEVDVEPGAGEGGPSDVVRGLVDGSLAVTGSDPFAVAAELLDRVLIGGGDLVTFVTGQAGDELARRLAAYLDATRPDVEVHVHRGRQRRPLLVAGVE